MAGVVSAPSASAILESHRQRPWRGQEFFGMKLLRKLKPFDRKSGNLNVVIDTPKGSRNKYAFDFKMKAYKLRQPYPMALFFRSTSDRSRAPSLKTAILSMFWCRWTSPCLSDASSKRGCLE